MVLFQLLHSIFRPFSSDDKTLAFSTISQFEANRTFKAFKWLIDKFYCIIISSFPHWHQFQGVCHLLYWKIPKFVFQTRKPLGTRHCGTLEFHHSRNLSTEKCFLVDFFTITQFLFNFWLLTTKLQCWHPMILAFAILISGGSFFAFNPSTKAFMRDHHGSFFWLK